MSLVLAPDAGQPPCAKEVAWRSKAERRLQQWAPFHDTLVHGQAAQAILSQEAFGILLLSLHSKRNERCLSLSCVRVKFVEVVRLTGHDASFVFASSDCVAEFCGSGARVAVTKQ